MAFILSDFQYDIFISYRHNDNLNGWVTDFLQNLEKELRSTLKDTLTIYFDRGRVRFARKVWRFCEKLIAF